MAQVKIFVSSCERVGLTQECLAAIQKTVPKGQADVFVFDGCTTSERHKLTISVQRWINSGQISAFIANPQEDLKNVYWSKNYMWEQFLDLHRNNDYATYFVMFDNDAIPRRKGWLEASIKVLNQGKKDGIRIVSPYEGDPTYETTDRIQVAGLSVERRKRCVSRCWVAHKTYWYAQGSPTYKEIVRYKRKDRMPTDTYYYEKLGKDEYIGVLFPPFVMDPNRNYPSARMALRKVGADVR